MDSYYAYIEGRTKWLKDNPDKTERDWIYVGVDVQDKYIDLEMEKHGFIKDRYLGCGVWEWSND